MTPDDRGESMPGPIGISDTRDCPLCGETEIRLLHRVQRQGQADRYWSCVECCGCRMVYLGERVSYMTQVEDFDWAETFPAESIRRDRQRWTRRAISRGLAALKRITGRENGNRMVRLVRRYIAEGRLVDFGCGEGMLLARAAPYFTVTGIDISEKLAVAARGRLPGATILVSPVTNVDLPAGSVDVVTMQSYIEHEQDPLGALDAAFRVLIPGGIVALKAPNYASWNRWLHGRNWCGFRYPDHCNYFTRRTLGAALERVGFKLVPGSFSDRLPTSDNMYLVGRKPDLLPLGRRRPRSIPRRVAA